MSQFLNFLEDSWFYVSLITIIFIAILIFRDLNGLTRQPRTWHRISYAKSIPRLKISSLHYIRKGQLLSNPNYTICLLVREDLLKALKTVRGLSQKELEDLVTDKKQLGLIFPNPRLVEFLHSPKDWMTKYRREPGLIEGIIGRLKALLEEEDPQQKELLLELALLISNFRTALHLRI
ncbi:MAG: hypothetical protein GF308_02120 [Candidatus Heimdallarchaeota archaeon]|nr:hypothetical protein [Candidatus Heimdallarchaeota archaeon]